MGEIADAMLDGTLCSCCGTYLADEGVGYPVTCAGCGGEDMPPPRTARRAQARERGDADPLAGMHPDHPHILAARALAGEALRPSEVRVLANLVLQSVQPVSRRWALRSAIATKRWGAPAQEGQGNG